MAVEYLRVLYPLIREVKANDVLVGLTNARLRLPADFYTITLDGLQDYDPPTIDVVLGGTTREMPKVVVFAPKPKPKEEDVQSAEADAPEVVVVVPKQG